METESDYNSYKALIAKSPQACELCDQKFDNRFSSIVHNSSHIIIPLQQQQLYCGMCCISFISTNDFNTHMSEHRPITNNHIEFDIKPEHNNEFDRPEVKLETLPQLNSHAFRVKQEKDFEGDEYDWSSSEDETLLEIVQKETERKCMQDEFEIKNEEEYADFINSQLKFEIDDEYSGLLKEFTSDCVDIQDWSNDENNDSETYNGNSSITNSIVFEEPVDEFVFENPEPPDVPLKADEEHKSVHYSDLMSFELSCCKYCCEYFSNRFSLIVHETTHMRIDKRRRQCLMLCPQCDICLVGNYRTVQKHEAAVHGTFRQVKRVLKTCDKCGLRYRSYTRHISIYHRRTYEPFGGSKKKAVKDLVESVPEPVQMPIPVPVQVHIQEPVQELIRMPVQEPIKIPVQKPVNMPVQEPYKIPVQEPITRLVQEPIKTPVQEPYKIPVQELIKIPVQERINMPVQEPVNLPVQKPILFGMPVQMPLHMQKLLIGPFELPLEVLLQESVQETIQEPVQESVQETVVETVVEPIQEHVQKPHCDWIEKFFTIKVCNLCFSFFKSSFKKVYILKGTFSYNTERPCDECKNLFFKLKTVRTIIRIHKSQMNRGSARNTNKERLKKIQVRLKMINKLGKCYDDVLLIFLSIDLSMCLKKMAGRTANRV